MAAARGDIADRGDEDRPRSGPRAIAHDPRLIGWRHRRKLPAISGEDTVRVERVERRLAAILAADVAGYSRLMGEDEEGTLAAPEGAPQ
jgi:class 3 adenylate cyclase